MSDELMRMLGEELSDTETGPLSDTPYVRAEVETDGALSLFETTSDASWPDASVDVPQLAHAILASDWLAAYTREVAEAERERCLRIVMERAAAEMRGMSVVHSIAAAIKEGRS